MSTEEKSEQDRQNEEQDNQTDPILQGCRTNAISEITTSLQESKLTNTDLSPQHQNWGNEINQNKDIIEIANIKNLVLADIKKKKKKNSNQPAKPAKNPYNCADNRNINDYFKFNIGSNSLLPKEK